MKIVALGSCFGAGELYKDMVEGGLVTIGRLSAKGLDQIQKGDIVLYGGGEDISPSIYGEGESRYAHAPARPSDRDAFEIAAFLRAKMVGAYNYGICRGAQLLCCLSGGILVQHVNNHSGRNHWISLPDQPKKYMTSSAHHQMMWPYNMAPEKFKLIAWADENLSQIYAFNEKDVRSSIGDKKEPEVVWFPETKSLCIQGHPEFMSSSRAPLVVWSRELLQQYCLGKE